MACNIIGSMASLLAEVEAGDELLFDGDAVTLREAAEDPPLFFDLTNKRNDDKYYQKNK